MDRKRRLMENNNGWPLRSQLFDGAPFRLPLLSTAVPASAATGTTATFTRATTKTFTDHEGVLRTAPAGCAAFTGARFVRNLQSTSSEPTSGWTADGATPPTVTYTTLDGTGAVSMAFPVVAAGFANSRCTGQLTSVSWVQNSTKIATRLVASLSRPLTGTEALTLYLSGTSALDDVFIFNASNTPTTATLQAAIDTFVNPSFTGTMGVIVYVSGAIVGSPVTLSLTRIQWQDITGRTDQTTPSEYVSVGVESAPYYHGSFVDGVKCFATDINGTAIPSSTLLGYSAEGARTNLCLQSNAFTTTWGTISAPTIAQNATGPDGGTTAWTITDDSGVASEGIAQAILLTAATHTLSVFVKKTTGAQASYPVVYAASATHIAPMTIDTSNGVATAWSAYTGFTIASGLSATCVSYNNDFWRCSVTFTASAANWSPSLIPAGTTNATQSTGTLDVTAQGSAVFYGAQVELGSFASSYIPTTTVAAKRNADVLTYSSSGNIDGTKGWAYAEVTMPTSVASVSFVAATGGNFPAYSSSDSELSVYDGTAERKFLPMTTSPAVKNIATTWGGTVTNASLSGTVGTSDGFDGNLDIGADLFVGIDSVSTSNLNGTIRNIRIGQRALSSSELQAITA